MARLLLKKSPMCVGVLCTTDPWVEDGCESLSSRMDHKRVSTKEPAAKEPFNSANQHCITLEVR